MKKILSIIFITFISLRLEAFFHDIPENEAKKIKFLFEYLIYEHDFSYTIFGSKPMSLADICLWEADLSIPEKFRSDFFLIQIKEGLNAWYKYKQSLDFKEYILLDREEDLFECLVFVLINKQSMLSLLHSHEKIFRQKLGEEFNPESFLAKIERREITLAKAINHDQGLLGIMLGYGVRNAMLFQERSNLVKQIEKKKELLFADKELEKKFQTIESQLQNFSEFEEFAVVMPLHFGADLNHPETIELQKKYESDRQKIAELMKKPNFIEKALKRLSGQETSKPNLLPKS